MGTALQRWLQRLHTIAQFCTVLYGTVQESSTQQCSTALSSTVQYNTVCPVFCSTFSTASAIQYSTVLYCTVQCRTVLYSTYCTVTSDLMVIVWSLQDSTCKQTQPIDLHSAWQPAWQRPRSTQLCTAAQRLQDSTCDYCSPFNSQCKKTRVSHCLSVRRCAYILSSTVQYLTFCEPHRRVQDTAAHNTVHSTVEYCTVQYSVVLEPRG